MATNHQKDGVHLPPGVLVRPPPGEEVVISGISGIFPSSDNTAEFMENLYKNVDLVTENDLNFYHPEAPRHLGQIKGLNKFDSQFFRITYHHAMDMEPVSRKLLEQAYMAIYDSGINPLALKGKKVGVFIGTSFSDSSNVAMYFSSSKKGFVLSGCGKSMFANRISYWIDAVGPSYSLDCSCASSMVCLEHAYQAMVNGECEAAIVGGGNICKLPQLGLNLRKGNLASVDGKTKCFSKNGDGPVRAEAINCIFLQKAKDAKRIYAEVYYTQVMYGLKDDSQFLPIRKSKDIVQFFQNFYANIDVSPTEVDYIEADGSAIAEADSNELEAIAEVFTKEKHTPLKVGSVKSVMGHAEPASGVCAITKVCMAYHKGELPANLHYTEPVDVPELKEGKIRVLQENEHFNRGYTAINQFSYTGINCHVLLKGHYKPKDTSKYKTSIPRLVLVSGRKNECVQKIFKTLESQPIDPEIIGMLHNIYQINTPGHTSRGYAIIDTIENNKTVTLSQNVNHYSGSKNPLCLVFSGMGSQWPGMATELMKIPTFAATIHKCHKALEPMGVDLIRVLTEPDETMFDNILNCFIGISAVQIGLTDVLKEIGLVPDYIIGHSQGEMCCAYWDNCLTTEEAIKAAYSRGIISYESSFIKGSMAAVGLGYNDIFPLCPPEIDVACHNSNESATLSGPAEDVQKFVVELTQKGIFAREVQSANIAFHSRYIQNAGPEFLKRLKQIIPIPKLRSEKWICTSVPSDKWNEDLAKYSSAEFHTNNLMSPVLFEEGAKLLPKNAVIVEVAPHGLLQSILKRSHPECTHIPLTRRGHENPIKFLFEGIGKLYQEGFNFKVDAFYPEIEYPVATETQMLSHYVDWEHSENWKDVVSNKNDKVTAIIRELIISVYDDEFKYLEGFIRDGNNVLNESALLFFVWETLAIYKGVDYNNMSVVFHDVQFHAKAIILAEEPFRLNFMINKGNDYFEVTKDEILLANGFVAEIKKPKFEALIDENEDDRNTQSDEKYWENEISLSSNDIYKHFHFKGLTYRGEFQSIKLTNFKRTTALVKSTKNWITLLDSLVQLNILAKDDVGITVPKLIKKLTINTDDFKEAKTVAVDGVLCFNAKLYSTYNVTRCSGIEMKHIIFDEKIIKQQTPDVLGSLGFVPFTTEEEVNIKTALQIILQIVSENVLDEIVTATEVMHDKNFSIFNMLQDVSDFIPNVTVEVQTVEMKNVNVSLLNSNLIILLNLFNNGTNINDVLNKLNDSAFILTFDQSDLKIGYFDKISSLNVEGKKLLLLRKMNFGKEINKIYLPIKNDDKFDWVPILKSELQKTKQVVLVSEKNPHCGLIGLVKALKKDYSNKISLVILDDYNASFDKDKLILKEQLQKNLAFNVLQKGLWGSHYYIQTALSTKTQSMKLVNAIPGEICGLKWITCPATTSRKQLVQVCYAGTSVRDSQKVFGMVDYNGEVGLGYDFSGFDSKGERVMGLISGGSITSTVQADPELLWPVPNSWSLEDAATVPLPYIHACYCLAIKAQVKRGHSVFVNGGAGALGQAVISIALHLNCTVYTSVSDDQKKQFLVKAFPQLDESNICETQNGQFYSTIIMKTKGNGCNVVLNSASGYLREAAMKCTAEFGVFIDVNEVDWNINSLLGMEFVTNDRNYIAARLSTIFRPENSKERKKLQLMIAEGIVNGSVKPISRIVYATSEVSRAFRLLNLNKHRGRVLFKIRNAEISAQDLNVVARMTFSDNGTYVIVCDKTALGIELANRFVNGGVKKIMLHMKSKTLSGLLHMRLATWIKLGTQIKISTDKLYEEKNCIQFLNEANKLGRIHGIFIVQESTNDNVWNQDNFVNKYETNVKVASKLDVLSRNNCPELSNFVVISRSSKNAVDEYTTSVADKICHNRLKVGLPALSFRIELLDELQTENLSSQIEPQNITTVLNALETCVEQKQSSVITFNLKKIKYASCLNKIIKCLNLDSLDNVDSILIVNDVITNDIQLEELKAIIKDSCQIEYTTDKLRRLSVSSLKSLVKKKTKQNNKFHSKLGAFFTFVDNDEYMATNAMVSMETIVNKDVESNQLDENATHLLLFPGFEGHHNVFKTICERLKVRAATFQFSPDATSKSIHEIANNIFKLIKRTFVFKSKFYLLGYSFGVNVALEIAALLEKEGHIGVVYCLDSGPDVLRAQLDAYIGKKTENQLQDSIIEHFFQLMSGKNCTELSKEILKINNWSDKVKACVNRLKVLVQYTNQYMHNVIESAYERIILAKNYNCSLRLNSELVLLRGLPHPNSGNLASDYGLSEYTKKPVRVIDIATDHAHAPYDHKIPNIVNKLIDPQLMEDYKRKLCHTYVPIRR